MTDVIGFNPYCTWANPVNLTATSLNVTMNSTDVPTNALSVHLEGLNLKVLVPSAYFRACIPILILIIRGERAGINIFSE